VPLSSEGGGKRAGRRVGVKAPQRDGQEQKPMKSRLGEKKPVQVVGKGHSENGRQKTEKLLLEQLSGKKQRTNWFAFSTKIWGAVRASATTGERDK